MLTWMLAALTVLQLTLVVGLFALRRQNKAASDRFLSRYGRKIWIALMGVSVISSSLAVTMHLLEESPPSAIRSISSDHTARSPQVVAVKEYTWTQVKSPKTPDMDVILQKLRGKLLVFIYRDSDKSWALDQDNRQLTLDAIAQWNGWTKKYRLRARWCHWEKIASCPLTASGQKNRIVVVLPGQWSQTEVNRLIHSGESVFVYGPPAQAFRQTGFAWGKLHFFPMPMGNTTNAVIRGDSRLTLGLSAGDVLQLHPLHTRYAALSTEADVLTLAQNPASRSWIKITRLASGILGKGRWVWGDLELEGPEGAEGNAAADQMTAAIFRFLLREEYDDVSSWPEGKKWAILKNVGSACYFDSVGNNTNPDMEFYRNANDCANSLFAESPDHASPKSAIHSVAPDNATLSILFSAGFTSVVSGSPPCPLGLLQLTANTTAGKILKLTPVDYGAEPSRDSPEDAARISQDLRTLFWTNRNSSDKFPNDAYPLSLNDLSVWTEFRQQLRSGDTEINPELLIRFKPIKLRVNTEGNLVREVISY